MLSSINPATGETLATFDELTSDQIEAKLRLASDSFLSWRLTPFARRSSLMANAAEILEQRQRHYGEIITREMGKPVKAAVAEVTKCAWVCRYYAENAEQFLRDEDVETNAARSYVKYQPLGIVLAVMPWNFPFWQVFRFAAPGLMAGNVGLLKHASNVPQSALAIEEIFRDAGFPAGTFQTLLVGSKAVRPILEDARVAAATLTGSEPAGADVASTAGRVIKKTVLELGGSDPFIVAPSADLDATVALAVKARCVNNGQSCIAAKRFIVFDSIADEFEKRFSLAMAALEVGDPMEDDTDIGPLATPQILDDVEAQVNESIARGARLLTGGKRVGKLRNYYEPTVLTNIPKDAPAYADEIFGPVAAVFRVRDVDEAIRLANATPFGLGAAAFTKDPEEQREFAEGIDAGQVFINAMVASDPRVPFGGVKKSGYGRELGVFGIREFVNIKTIWVQEAATARKEKKVE